MRTQGGARAMVTPDAEMALDELAALHDGLAHPARVAAMRALRQRKRMPLAELRRAVSEAWRPLDARSMQFHAHRMMVAGLVDVKREDGREVVALVRDVTLRQRVVG